MPIKVYQVSYKVCSALRRKTKKGTVRDAMVCADVSVPARLLLRLCAAMNLRDQ